MADINEVVVRGSAAGFAQEILARRHLWTADESVAARGSRHGPNSLRLTTCCLGRLNFDDGCAVCATQELAARSSHRLNASLFCLGDYNIPHQMSASFCIYCFPLCANPSAALRSSQPTDRSSFLAIFLSFAKVFSSIQIVSLFM